MNTLFLLMAQYQKPVIPLTDVCQDYFGMSPTTAKKKATAGLFPIPVTRMGSSQKSLLTVHIADLAEYIDRQAEVGRYEWRAINE